MLVLGSMPGSQSLKEHQYYANSRNQFWRIIYFIFGTLIDQDYDKRVLFLKDKGIALWDVIESCSREGSLDSDIKGEKINDFNRLFKAYPGVKFVVFNGGKAFETFRKRLGFDFPGITYKKLPSTSPAYSISFERKVKEWEVIHDYINP